MSTTAMRHVGVVASAVAQLATSFAALRNVEVLRLVVPSGVLLLVAPIVTVLGGRRFGSALGAVAASAMALLLLLKLPIATLDGWGEGYSWSSGRHGPSDYSVAQVVLVGLLMAAATSLLSTVALISQRRDSGNISGIAVLVTAVVIVALTYFLGNVLSALSAPPSVRPR